MAWHGQTNSREKQIRRFDYSWITSLRGFVLVLTTSFPGTNHSWVTLCEQNWALDGAQSPDFFTQLPAKTDTKSSRSGVIAKSCEPQLQQNWRTMAVPDSVCVSE